MGETEDQKTLIGAPDTVVTWAGVVTAILAVLALFAFFMPWVYRALPFLLVGLPLEESTTGFALANTSRSAASGSNLYALFIPPACALLVLAMSIPPLRRLLGLWVPIDALVLAVVALASIAITLPNELDTWSPPARYGAGFWLMVVALAGIGMTALLELGVRLRHRKPRPFGLQPHLP